MFSWLLELLSNDTQESLCDDDLGLKLKKWRGLLIWLFSPSFSLLLPFCPGIVCYSFLFCAILSEKNEAILKTYSLSFFLCYFFIHSFIPFLLASLSSSFAYPVTLLVTTVHIIWAIACGCCLCRISAFDDAADFAAAFIVCCCRFVCNCKLWQQNVWTVCVCVCVNWWVERGRGSTGKKRVKEAAKFLINAPIQLRRRAMGMKVGRIAKLPHSEKIERG